MKRLIIFIVFLVPGFLAQAQTEQEIQLATEYYNNSEFDKAIIFFAKFYENTPTNRDYYNSYLVCLMATGDHKTAEKIIKKQVKDNPLDVCLQVDLASFYKTIGETKKSETEFEKLIKEVNNSSPERIDEAGSCMIISGEQDMALALYQKAKKSFPDYHIFNFQLAELYADKGENQAMIDELMTVLAKDPSMETAVENTLLTLMDDDPESELNTLIKSTLLKEVQQHPDAIVYPNLLIWMYTMHRNFEGAYIQSKALDKRFSEVGDRLIMLGRTCLDNRAYDVAVKCYEGVIEKGNSSPYYLTARVELLNVLNQKITGDYALNPEEVVKLETNYQETIAEIGLNSQSTRLVTELAHLQAFYLGKTDEAKASLQEILDGSRGTSEDIARAKIELADILVLTGDMWEPSLLYGQVEKDFKQDVIGQDAKFRNARLSFYRGEFLWAQEQMKVLKASTSKLMSNDALALSLLILDNSGLDSTFDALMLFSRADLLAYQGKNTESMQTLDTLESQFPYHSLQDEVLYKKAELYIKSGNTDQALVELEKIITNYSEDLLGDDAMFKAADMYEQHYKNNEKAMEYYKNLMVNYPGSVYVVEARKRFKQLRGDSVN